MFMCELFDSHFSLSLSMLLMIEAFGVNVVFCIVSSFSDTESTFEFVMISCAFGQYYFGARMSSPMKLVFGHQLAGKRGEKGAEIPRTRSPGGSPPHLRVEEEKKRVMGGLHVLFSSLMKREGHYKAQREV